MGPTGHLAWLAADGGIGPVHVAQVQQLSRAVADRSRQMLLRRKPLGQPRSQRIWAPTWGCRQHAEFAKTRQGLQQRRTATVACRCRANRRNSLPLGALHCCHCRCSSGSSWRRTDPNCRPTDRALRCAILASASLRDELRGRVSLVAGNQPLTRRLATHSISPTIGISPTTGPTAGQLGPAAECEALLADRTVSPWRRTGISGQSLSRTEPLSPAHPLRLTRADLGKDLRCPGGLPRLLAEHAALHETIRQSGHCGARQAWHTAYRPGPQRSARICERPTCPCSDLIRAYSRNRRALASHGIDRAYLGGAARSLRSNPRGQLRR